MLLIFAPTVIAVVESANVRNLTEQVKKAEEDRDVIKDNLRQLIGGNPDTTVTPFNVRNIINTFGVDKDELMRLMYEDDRHLFDNIISGGVPVFDTEAGTAPGSPADTADNSGNGGTAEANSSFAPAEGETTAVVSTFAGDGGDATDEPPSVTQSAGGAQATVAAPSPADTSMPATAADPADSAPSEFAEFYPDMYANTPDVAYASDKDTVYLTFDDGPSENTSDILHYLDKNNVKATFFVVPTQNGGDKLRKIAAAGHVIGVHTYSHRYKEIYASVPAFLDDFYKAWKLVYDQTGIKTDIYRFPGGSVNDYDRGVIADIVKEMTRRGFVYFDWNVDSGDALNASWTTMHAKVPADVENTNRAIVLMHDRIGGSNTVLVLDDVINAIKRSNRNFKFGTLDKTVRPIQFKLPG